MRSIPRSLLAWLVCTASVTAFAQTDALHPIDASPLAMDGPVLRAPVETGKPFTVAGPQGVLVGEQQGTFEAWVLPVKLLSHLTLEATVEGYPVPIDLNAVARSIEVRPDRTTVTYSHSALTVRQIMFAPDATPEGTGAVVLFQVDTTSPVNLTFRFTADMRPMWPQPSFGTASPEWVARGDSGLYILHTDYPSLAGAIALPRAKSGILAPYQERPQVHPTEFRLRVTPADRNRFFPLLMAAGRTAETATNAVLEAKLATLNASLPATYAAHAERYRAQAATLTAIRTPDPSLDEAFTWAVTSIGQLRAKAQPAGEVGLVAGYYASGDSARPGFGWFFGRDSLYTLYAIDSYGDFALARAELEFLMKHQRADGKVMHEYSQTAAFLDWAAFPYQYAAADATPLFLTATLDYIRASGDVAFLKTHREAIENAWHFETTHDADGDRIYDNAQGTGWVESWPPGMPKQEIYLALLDAQASTAMTTLATLFGDPTTSAAAATRAATLKATIEREYYQPGKDAYAFSRNTGGALDSTATIFPAIAWWNGADGAAALAHPQASLRRWASHDFATDWGARDLAETDPLYDPISYHQGSVWPLFTGWAAIAQYRSGHPLAGYQSTMQNADLTTAQDLGAVTELLSGAFFQPFGRSTSHQLWSSAMVVTPVLRGLFGIEVDALRNTIRVNPSLPADWPSAQVANLHIGSSVVTVDYRREAQSMLVTLRQVSGTAIHLEGAAAGVKRLPLPAVEIAIPHGLPTPGARTAQMKVLNETTGAHSLQLELEGAAGTETVLHLQRNNPSIQIKAEAATLTGNDLRIRFPEGTGYVPLTVTLLW